jgi:hypothetical protein
MGKIFDNRGIYYCCRKGIKMVERNGKEYQKERISNPLSDLQEVSNVIIIPKGLIKSGNSVGWDEILILFPTKTTGSAIENRIQKADYLIKDSLLVVEPNFRNNTKIEPKILPITDNIPSSSIILAVNYNGYTSFPYFVEFQSTKHIDEYHLKESDISHNNIKDSGKIEHKEIDEHISNNNIHREYISHKDLEDVGVLHHKDIDIHITRKDIHFDKSTIEHSELRGTGSFNHNILDNHLLNESLHFEENQISHDTILNRGYYKHKEIDNHINSNQNHVSLNDRRYWDNKLERPPVAFSGDLLSIGSDGEITTSGYCPSDFTKNNSPICVVGELLKGKQIKGEYINCVTDRKNNNILVNLPMLVTDSDGNLLFKKLGLFKKEQVKVLEITGDMVKLNYDVNFPIILWYWIKTEQNQRFIMYNRGKAVEELERTTHLGIASKIDFNPFGTNMRETNIQDAMIYLTKQMELLVEYVGELEKRVKSIDKNL